MFIDLLCGRKRPQPYRQSAWKEKLLLPLASLLIVCAVAAEGDMRAQTQAPPPVTRLIKERIQARLEDDRFTCQGERICGIASIPGFYAARGFEPAWSTSAGPSRQAWVLLEEISKAKEDGLKPEDYHYDWLHSMAVQLTAQGPDAKGPSPALRADFDLVMTDAAFLLGAHLLGGRVNPQTIHADWRAYSDEVDLAHLLNDGLQNDRVASLLRALHPPYTGYNGLRQALATYRKIEATGGWPALEGGTRLRLGDKGPSVATLRARLVATGDLADLASPLGADVFDRPLEDAVKAFQWRHGLDTDGVVGRKTRQAMNVPVQKRIQQLLINMERWRWIPSELGPRYIVVNIADFQLTMVDEGWVRGSMRVVVGHAYRKTPVFSGTMTYLEFNPFWNIPRRLAIEDILPHIQADPDYIEKQGIRIFSGWSKDAVVLAPSEVDWASLDENYFPIRLQQAPGPKNALGRIKFMFPNKYAVYLHDTPAKNLFNSVSRDFSSGCIRVEDPATLAEFVLEGTAGWDRETIEGHLGNAEHLLVRLQRPVPVHLLYWTAWADAEGTVSFREDIYERDAPLIRALREMPSPKVWTPTESLPGSHRADVDVDKIGFRVVADPAPTHAQGDFSDHPRAGSRNTNIGRLTEHMQALASNAAAPVPQLGIGSR